MLANDPVTQARVDLTTALRAVAGGLGGDAADPGDNGAGEATALPPGRIAACEVHRDFEAAGQRLAGQRAVGALWRMAVAAAGDGLDEVFAARDPVLREGGGRAKQQCENGGNTAHDCLSPNFRHSGRWF